MRGIVNAHEHLSPHWRGVDDQIYHEGGARLPLGLTTFDRWTPPPRALSMTANDEQQPRTLGPLFEVDLRQIWPI